MMYRVQYSQRGPVPEDVVEVVEFEPPTLQDDQVLVDVLAAPINPSDLLTLTGDYGVLPKLPATAGNEGVGRVRELGPNASSLEQGQTVLLPVGIGTWASHIVAKAPHLIPLPDQADPQQLSMVTVNPPTASLLLSEFVDLGQDDWVIQNAANSGVGGYLIQLAKMRGIRTVNVVRRESAAAELHAMGADVVLTDGDDLPERVHEATDGAAIRLGIDAVGGPATDHLASCLTDGGLVVNYGLMSGEPCHVSPKALVFRDITLKGFWLAHWFQTSSREQQKALYGELAALIASGKLQARVDSTWDVQDIREAIAEAGKGGRDGKVLIVPKGD